MCPGWRSAFEDPCTRPTRGRACSCAIARLLAKHALGPETPVHAPSHLHPASSSEEGPSLASGAPRGIGLGLYITRKIVEAHGGTIRVESEPGAGATLVVELPQQHVGERSPSAERVAATAPRHGS